MPVNYASAPVLKLQYTMDAATSGKVDPEAKVMAISDGDAQDVDTANFDTLNEVSGGTTVPGTAGFLDEISIPLINNDNVAPGDLVIVHIQRDHDDADDTASGDFELRTVNLEYTTI
jgi:hypothetical protein